MSTPTLTPHGVAMLVTPRGPLSRAVLQHLTGGTDHDDHVTLAYDRVRASDDVIEDDDIQLTLFLVYAASYGSLDGILPDSEWDPDVVETRRVLEAAFESELRRIAPRPATPEADQHAVADALTSITTADDGPSLSRYVAKRASNAQLHEFLVHRSIYTLREADPHSWAIPRLRGRAKAALVEIQADEYGGGRPDRIHAEIFGATMRGAGLDDTYGAYVDAVPGLTLASHNMMSLFGLNRRLLGAIVGHLAAFEMTSSLPNRMYGNGFRRLGYGTSVTDYFDEHVEADAVHEQIAAYDLAGALAEDRPDLLEDILFGAAACIALDAAVGAALIDAWSQGRSSLRTAVGG